MNNKRKSARTKRRAKTPILLRIPDTDISNEEHPLATLDPDSRNYSRQTAIASILARLAETHADNQGSDGTIPRLLETLSDECQDDEV